jgi:hypothetical protein
MKAISVDATCYPGPFRVDLYKRRFQKYLQAGALIENQNETMLAREYRSDYEQI